MNVTNGEIAEIQTWATFNKKIVMFQNQSNHIQFKEIFKDDWKRLLTHFVEDCDRRFDLFRTYLTTDQSNDLLIHIVKLKP